MKRQEAPRCTVNGFSRRSRNGWLAVKNQYGRRSVLLKVPATAEASPSSSPSPTATFSQRQRRISLQPFTDFTICAVNVNGFFKVDEGGSYSAGCLYSEEDYRTTMDEKLKLLRLEARKAKPSGCTPQRKVTKYMEFVGKFLATFSNTSFSDAGLTWGGFSATMRRSETVGTLINMVRDSGKYVVR